MTPLIQGFLLGIANGGSCLTACAPVFLPYMVAEGRPFRLSIRPVFCFLTGRLAGYLAFAVFAWEAGKWIRSEPRGGVLFGVVYATLAVVLVFYGFGTRDSACAALGLSARIPAILSRSPMALPTLMGLLTGLTLCPPFMTALAGAANQISLFSTLLYFLSFFIATSLYLAPFPFVGFLGRFASIRIVGRMAAGVMGCYLFYKSLIMISGGLQL